MTPDARSLVLCLLLAAVPAAQLAPRPRAPYVPVGVAYPSALARDRERATADLEVIHTLGFNSIRVLVAWQDAEPARGEYRFDTLDHVLSLAARARLEADLQLDTAPLPEWLLRRYPDGRIVSDSRATSAPPERACLDHPGVRADVLAFVRAASARAALQPAWQSIDVASDLESGVCLCPHTERRFRDWLKGTFGADARAGALAASDRAAFVAFARREDLALLAGAAARGGRLRTSSAGAPLVARRLFGQPPGQDDWLMASEVDRYGTLVPPDLGAVSLAPAQLAFALDGIRSATRDKGWLMRDRALGARTAPLPSAADLRFWTWAALSRGARGVTYAEWTAPAARENTSLVAPDGTISDRARAAGVLGRVIGRNGALFAPLRPRAATVAIVYDPRPPAARSPDAPEFQSQVYRALFDRNIPVDFVHVDEVAEGMAARYRLVFVDSTAPLPPPASQALATFSDAGGVIVARSTPPTDADVAQLAATAGVRPEVRVADATGLVETRFLESSDVLMLIGLNHADRPRRVTLTFTPDTQEAVWQNMETGAAVNFVAGADGPTYTYTFGPRDALVLMIRKHLR